MLAQPHSNNYQALEGHFTNYMLNCIVAHSFYTESGKFSVKSAIQVLEYFFSDHQKDRHLQWLAQEMIIPMLKEGFIELEDLEWYKEDEENELTNSSVVSLFKVAAFILIAQLDERK